MTITTHVYPYAKPFMYKLIIEALNHQRMFRRSTTPMEMKDWDYKKLQNFKIDTKNIDRCYYVEKCEDAGGREFTFLGRLKYKEEKYPLFIELRASCDYTGFDCQGGGKIYLTRYAQLYYDVVSRNTNAKVKNALQLALKKDNYNIRDIE